MNALSESQIQKKIVTKFRDAGEVVFKMQLLHITGVPDLLFILKGGCVMWMEVKQPGCDPTPKQYWFHNLLKKLGHFVAVVTSLEEALLAYKVYHEAKRMGISPEIKKIIKKTFDPETYQDPKG